jgi:quinohemoprotein ethanol dehydrogenase
VWDGFAYDPETNLVYVGTGNAEPWVQKFRGAQGLDNLYTCSILAVDLTTGQLKWHYQAVPNDNWDFDNVQQLMLLNLNINGRVRKVITQAAKDGFFYILDRVSGEFISAVPFVKVSWALRMGEDGRPVVNPAAYYDLEPISIYPTGGGASQLVADVVQPEYRARLHSVVVRAVPLSGAGGISPRLDGLRAPSRTDEDHRADNGT